MSRLRLGHGAGAGLVACTLGVAIAASTCSRADSRSTVAGTVTLVNRVRAQISGLACPTCPATVEAALRQRLDAADITIVPGQTVDLVFERSASAFPSASFREVLGNGGGEVRSIHIEVCGSIDETAGQPWLTSGSARLLLEGPGPYVTGADVCVTGELRDQASPARLVLGTFGS